MIALTAVASRQAGWACAAWLFSLGVLGKVAGLITSIPDCVIGGMTTFLFANVVSSGIKIVVGEHLSRRNRFIMGCALALGLGVTLVPAWALNALWPCADCGSGLKGLRDAIISILSTGFCIGAIVAMLLNLILPLESPMVRAPPAVPAPASCTRPPSRATPAPGACMPDIFSDSNAPAAGARALHQGSARLRRALVPLHHPRDHHPGARRPGGRGRGARRRQGLSRRPHFCTDAHLPRSSNLCLSGATPRPSPRPAPPRSAGRELRIPPLSRRTSYCPAARHFFLAASSLG